MLSNSVTTTPRPLPPAKARRISSMQYSRIAPPPPYEPSLQMGMNSPLSATPQLIRSITSPDGLRVSLPSPAMEEWMNDKSREELSGLLLKADGLIKSRETELSLTSALCKSLYHDNVALKNKHETLLARLPSSPAPTAPSSPLLTEMPMAKFSSCYEDSLKLSPNYDFPLTASRPRHARRISVTPAELDHLADQNAELLDKLEKLEEEAQLADQAGKRKLRKLEKEIQALRDELESTQTKEAELERQAKGALAMTPSEVQRRKEEREERVKAFKEKSATDAPAGSEEVKDFAPPPELPRGGMLNMSSSTAAHDHDDAAPSYPVTPPEILLTPLKSDVEDDFSVSGPSRMVRKQSNPQAEFAIISQLLVKIQELEEMNAQMKHAQNLTDERLRSAQWDAESIRRVYDCLGDGADVELQILPDDFVSPLKDKSSWDGTIRFSSLRRSINFDLSRDSEMDNEFDDDGSDVFGSGIPWQSTTRSGITPRGSAGPRMGHKARKSVVGLFEPGPATPSRVLDTPDFSPSARMVPSPLGAPSELGDISMWSIAATEGVKSPSPFLTDSLPTPTDGPERGHTLGSELGSEFGDDWGANAGNHHLRTTSLYDLTGLNLSREVSVSPVVSPGGMPAFVFPSQDDLGAESTPVGARKWSAAGPSTPPRSLQLTVEPPTPASLKTSRTQRLSQTMRARTNRWVERRYGSPQPLSEPAQMLRQRRAMAAGRRSVDASMSETFDEVLQTFSRAGSLGSIAPLAGEADAEPAAELDADCSVLELHSMSRAETSAVLNTAGTRRDGFTGFMLEVWLWLQFTIVVLVFLWTMAKRGPKSVLEEAERRRVQQGT